MRVRDQGFTLVELLVALVMGSFILTAVYQTILTTQRNSAALSERIDVQQNVRLAAHYITSTLRELDASDQDLVIIGSDAIRFRSMRWAGVLCADPVTAGADVSMPVRRAPFYGTRDPVAALDSVLVFRDGEVTNRTDDRWLAGGVQQVGNGACADGSPATILRVRINAASGGNDSALVGVTSGAPMRGFQIEDLMLFESNGRWWLGQRTADRGGKWTDTQRLVGPLQSGGLAFAYFDANGAPTAVPTEVAGVGLTVRGESRGRARASDRSMSHVRDSIETGIALRNNRRF
jgi:prepilin-type N-terminal cleavage/methylation domain-containing protein